MNELVINPVTVNDLTTATIDGTGVFDRLMTAGAAHIESQFNKSRIQGADYATVYLGLINASMNSAINFLMNKDKIALEANLIAAQIKLTEAQIARTEVEVRKLEVEMEKLEVEKELIIVNKAKINKEIEFISQQIITEKAQVSDEGVEDNSVIGRQKSLLAAQTCKAKSEYDLTLVTKEKVTKESELLVQKTITEKAQTLELGVDENSLIGRQKSLYTAQINGFKSDKIQKGTKLMIDSWQARRMTDDGVVADDVNKLGDSHVGQAVTNLLADMNA